MNSLKSIMNKDKCEYIFEEESEIMFRGKDVMLREKVKYRFKKLMMEQRLRKITLFLNMNFF